MAPLFRVFALSLVLVLCLASFATALPLKEDSITGDAADMKKSASPTDPGTEKTSLSRVPRGIGLGLGYYPYSYSYGPCGYYYPRPTLLGCLLSAKRRILGTLGGLFRPRPWGYYGYY